MRLLLAMLLVPSLALAAEEKSAAASGDPMAGWVPPKVKNEAKDKKEIQALLQAMDSAGKTGDLDAASALVDFPVTMMTDDSKGQGSGEAWSREQWTQVMKPFYDKPMKDAKVTHKTSIFLVSDSLASVDDVYTMTQGGKSTTGRTSAFVIRRDGKWRVKTMAEGGWGDMTSQPSASGGGQGGSPAAGSTGGPSQPSGERKGEGDVQAPKEPAPAERTTK